MKGISAIIATLLLLVIAIALAGVVYTFTVGLIPTKAIDIVGVSCDLEGNNFYIVVKNLDTRLSIDAEEELRTFVEGEPVDATWSPTSISPGNTSVANVSYTVSAGEFYRIKVIGPTNEVEKSVAC